MAPTDAPSPAPPRRRVLIVEDMADVRESLHLLLQLWGHQVEVAEDGVQGLEKALAWRPDVAVLDIGLPRLTGYEVARRLRAELHEQILLIALTGYGQDADRRQALAAGFDVHMTKPADLERLSRLVAGAGA